MGDMGSGLIGRYEIISELGRGGMAAVHLARDPYFDRQVAIKVLPPQLTRDTQYLSRFRREARVIAALEHPYIVPVYDYGEQDGQPYLVMRYMPGGTLANRMVSAPLPLSSVVPVVSRLAEALNEAHLHNIVHRDLKPTNVMFDARDQAYLSDFGVAKILEASGAESLTGSSVIGTPAYMSPEQAVGDRLIDQRSDIYSLGVMTFEMLTGRQPYQADTPVRLLLKHVTEPVPQLDLAELARLGLPAGLNSILARALAKKPENRYSTATDLAAPLQRLLSAPVSDGARSISHAARRLLPRRADPKPPVLPDTASTMVARPSTRPSAGRGIARLGRGVILGGAGLVGALALVALGVWMGQSVTGMPTATSTIRASATPASGRVILTPSRTPTNAPAKASPSPPATPTPTTPSPTTTGTPSPTVTATETRTPVPRTATRRPQLPATFVPPTPTWTEAPLPTAAPPPDTAVPSPIPIPP